MDDLSKEDSNITKDYKFSAKYSNLSAEKLSKVDIHNFDLQTKPMMPNDVKEEVESIESVESNSEKSLNFDPKVDVITNVNLQKVTVDKVIFKFDRNRRKKS